MKLLSDPATVITFAVFGILAVAAAMGIIT